MNNDLHQAYMETTYVVSHHETSFNLKIGAHDATFNHWCKEKGINTWAIITAFNPYSQALTAHENEQLNTDLKHTVLAYGFVLNDAKGVPRDEHWDAEASFFIHNISLEQAQAIGILFKQNAIVYGFKDNTNQLVWLV